MNARHEITRLLQARAGGDERALDILMPLVYEELQGMAHGHLRRERDDHTLDTTDLVHESYLKLANLDRIEWKNRAHFLALASQAMRRVLVSYAVKQRAQKRGGGERPVTFEEEFVLTDERADQVLALDEALSMLAEASPRQSEIVQMRFFGGMNIDETADALDVSPATVKRDQRMALAWLGLQLQDDLPELEALDE